MGISINRVDLLNALLSPARRSVPSEHEYSGNKKPMERTLIEAHSFQLNQHDLQYTVTNNSIKDYVHIIKMVTNLEFSYPLPLPFSFVHIYTPYFPISLFQFIGITCYPLVACLELFELLWTIHEVSIPSHASAEG
jgi:hypothetical protein